jgi:preprotein translocase subunit Sss1
MDQVVKFVEPAKQFFKDSYRLVKKCTKPDRKGKFIQNLVLNKLKIRCF